MDRWQNLRDLLKSILGSNNVYFQPPPTIKIEYPCIIFERDADQATRADDKRYTSMYRYSILYIRRTHDTAVPEAILDLPLCSYDRFYTADGLNHDAFSIYY